MIIHSRKRSNIVAGKQKVENKQPEEKKARPKKVVKKEEEPILPLVKEALASVEE